MSLGRGKKSSSSSTEGSPTEYQTRLRAPDNSTSPFPASRSVSMSSLNYLSLAAEPTGASKLYTARERTPSETLSPPTAAAAKEKRNRKRSLRLSTSSESNTSSSPGRFARSMKRVSSAFKSGSSTTSETRSEWSDTDSRVSASVASSVNSPSPPLSSVAVMQPPQTPRATPSTAAATSSTSTTAPAAAATTTTSPLDPPHDADLGGSSFLVLNTASETVPAPTETEPPLSSFAPAMATPLAEQPPSPVTSMSMSSPPQPASVGFPEVDQIGDEPSAPETAPSQPESIHPDSPSIAAQEQIPASMDYPPVDSLIEQPQEEEEAEESQRVKEVIAMDSSEDEDDEDHIDSQQEKEDPTPSHSLTVSAWRAILNPQSFTMSVSTKRKLYLVAGSLAINLLLPFINGVMLGLGEIFARESVAIYFGLGPKASAGPRPATANVGSVGLRAAGASGGGNPKPGKASVKTAAEMAEEAVRRI